MRHAGKARQEGVRFIRWGFIFLLLSLAGAALGSVAGSVVAAAAAALAVLWILFLLFCLNFFRDPDPTVPADPQAIVSPAHGTVDVIDETMESQFVGGRCRRISIFLSVIDVHIQSAPVAGQIAYLKRTPGKFLNAMKTEASTQNENVLIGFESGERPGEKISVRLIAGLIARRIVPWVAVGDVTARGERTSLIRFGSRVDLYLPLTAQVAVRLGDKVKGGETIMAIRP
jgi:phosphatidylserine decarboxylase